MRRTHGNVYVLDEVDRRLVDVLRADPRASNRSIAEAVGVTDETVAARLKRMLDTGAMAMTVVVDWLAAGYTAHAIARVRFTGVSTAEAVKPLFDVDGVFAVSETTGVADAVLHLLAPDVLGLQQLIDTHLRPLDGLSHLSVDIVSDTCKQSLGISTLPMPAWSPSSFPAPVVALDELDERILVEVAADGHESNRELARRLGVSDGTIRARLGRMVSAGLVRVVVMVDPITTADVGAVAHVFFSLDGPPDPLLDQLLPDPRVPTVTRCVGAYDVQAIVDAETPDELHARVSRELRTVPGVRSIDLGVVVDVPLHRAHLGRLL
jgi:DNA-binding Lrp family transcriptional regulator